MNTLYLSLLAIQDGLQVKGWIVTISGFLIVIMALVILFLIFSGVSKIINADWRSIVNKDKRKNEVEVVDNSNKDMSTSKNNINDDVIVAIGLALSMSMEVHDEESGVLTIKRTQRVTSPWASKILGINNLNRY
ncbi:MAG: OadG family protein [Bacteroidales bacterium]|nr:OadG family protein [Bacteroidales bacterium]